MLASLFYVGDGFRDVVEGEGGVAGQRWVLVLVLVLLVSRNDGKVELWVHHSVSLSPRLL